MRFTAKDVNSLIGAVEEHWAISQPNMPFDYLFLDDDYNRYFRSQHRQARMMQTFALLAIFIALLGLIGLVNYSTERRTKEIGVRKVLGASEPQIIGLVTKEFTILVLLANMIAWPLAYLAMHRWLQEFAFRTTLAWWIFPLAGLVALLIAWVGLVAIAWRASLTNPVEALRHE
jgi:putative ABC transport system permease protein